MKRNAARTRQPRTTAVHSPSIPAWDQLRTHGARSPQLQPSTWVRLRHPPTAFSFDEAWLLCQYAEDQWLAWIPDYGEILLNINDLYAAT